MAQKPNNKPPMQPQKNRPTGSIVMYIIYAVIILGLGSMLVTGKSSENKEINWERLSYIIENGD